MFYQGFCKKDHFNAPPPSIYYLVYHCMWLVQANFLIFPVSISCISYVPSNLPWVLCSGLLINFVLREHMHLFSCVLPGVHWIVFWSALNMWFLIEFYLSSHNYEILKCIPCSFQISSSYKLLMSKSICWFSYLWVLFSHAVHNLWFSLQSIRIGCPPHSSMLGRQQLILATTQEWLKSFPPKFRPVEFVLKL